jgi:hypothetical protein
MPSRTFRGCAREALALSLLTCMAGCFTTPATFKSEAGATPGPADATSAEGSAAVDSGMPLEASDAPGSADATIDAGAAPDATLDATGAIDATDEVDAVVLADAADAQGEAGPPAPSDPYPTTDVPGLYCAPGAPQIDGAALADAGYLLPSVSTPTVMLSGGVTGAAGDGVYYVVGTAGNVNRQLIPTDTVAGTYAFNALLFCGTQTVKQVWSNAQGTCALVEQITRTGDDGGPCAQPDLQVSLAWDALGEDWELHLIRQGGTINSAANDCTWTTCISSHPDWGVQGDPSDDPSKDVDNTGTYGPENIFLNRPEAITYTVMVEHWGSGQPGASGTVTINLAGHAPMVIGKSGLASHHVWKAATIAYAVGALPVVTAFQDDIDCTASWSGGCTLAIP